MKTLVAIGIVLLVSLNIGIYCINIQLSKNVQNQVNNLGGGGRTNEKERAIFTAVEISTTSFPFLVNDYQHIGVTIAASSTTATIQFACSNLDETTTIVNSAGRFATTSKNLTARWDWVQVIDLEDGTSIDGDTGVVLSNASDVRQFEIDTNNFRWCMAYHAWSAGSTTITFRPINNL